MLCNFMSDHAKSGSRCGVGVLLKDTKSSANKKASVQLMQAMVDYIWQKLQHFKWDGTNPLLLAVASWPCIAVSQPLPQSISVPLIILCIVHVERHVIIRYPHIFLGWQ